VTNEFNWIFVLAVAAVIGLGLAWSLRRRVRINPWERGAVYVEGAFEKILPPGRHILWGSSKRVRVSRIFMMNQYQQVGPVEVVTSDRLPARLSATCIYRLHDAELSIQEPVSNAIGLAVSTSLVRLAAGWSLDELVSRADGVDEALAAGIAPTLGAATIDSVVLTGVVLPPELRRLMSEVERARLEGLAALERARGEHAALRSLANASRLLKDNPELAHLRLLQTVASARNATIVIGDKPGVPIVTP